MSALLLTRRNGSRTNSRSSLAKISLPSATCDCLTIEDLSSGECITPRMRLQMTSWLISLASCQIFASFSRITCNVQSLCSEEGNRGRRFQRLLRFSVQYDVVLLYPYTAHAHRAQWADEALAEAHEKGTFVDRIEMV